MVVAFNPEHKEVLDSVLLLVPGVVAGTMFGYPAYYINKKNCSPASTRRE